MGGRETPSLAKWLLFFFYYRLKYSNLDLVICRITDEIDKGDFKLAKFTRC